MGKDQVKHEVTKGRGATLQIEGRFESVAREHVDDGWGTADEELPPFKTTVTIDSAKSVIQRHDFARHPVRLFAECVSRLRARLHLLLRAAFARLPESFAGAGFRDQAVCQAGCGEAAARGTGQAFLPVFADRARFQHRSLPADRARMEDHAADTGGAGGAQASGFHRHQVRAGRARPRCARRNWRATIWCRCSSRSPRWMESWRAGWSRAPRRRAAGCKRCRR